jgi:hypothetical protein
MRQIQTRDGGERFLFTVDEMRALLDVVTSTKQQWNCSFQPTRRGFTAFTGTPLVASC